MSRCHYFLSPVSVIYLNFFKIVSLYDRYAAFVTWGTSEAQNARLHVFNVIDRSARERKRLERYDDEDANAEVSDRKRGGQQKTTVEGAFRCSECSCANLNGQRNVCIDLVDLVRGAGAESNTHWEK